MIINIFPVPFEKKYILRHMLELYLYDMSDVSGSGDRMDLNEAGLFEYKYLDHYWTEEKRYPYLMTADDKYCGFALTTVNESGGVRGGEFFIMRKYRNQGLGSKLAAYIFDKHRGECVIYTPVRNIMAQHFWRKAIQAAAIGNIAESIVEFKSGNEYMQWKFRNDQHS